MNAPDSTPSRTSRTGVLLVNLGTPDAPRTPEVRRYLREFLSDPRVIDVSAAGRWALVNLVIAPFRSPRSAEAYRKVWTERGSPLLVHGEDLAAAVRERLGPDVPVELAMRYGNPPVGGALERLRAAGADRVVVLPLFPQFASATTGSALEKVYAEAGRLGNVPDLATVPAFFDHPGFIRAFAGTARPVLARLRPDRVLMSYHGLPERQVRRADPTGSRCLASADCCDRLQDANRNCYRAQCFETSRRLAAALGLESGRWQITFQSRLGRTPWIRPYTDLTLAALPGAGVKRVAVMSPAFVADCLETLEEIAIRGKETFLKAGGEAFELVPSLNAGPAWVDTVVDLVREGTVRVPRADA